MNKDQKLLEEAYQSIYESAVEPLYFGPPERKQEFLDWLKKLKHEVHSDGSVSVEGDVLLKELGLDRMPFNFRSATGHFDCYYNNLTSLKGAPKEIGGDFYCYCNYLTSLKGAPKKVGGGFYCHYNYLTSLKGAPNEVEGDFSCHNNKLTSLEGAPEIIKGDFTSDQFSDADYRAFAKKRKYVDNKLDKDLNVDLEDFS